MSEVTEVFKVSEVNLQLDRIEKNLSEYLQGKEKVFMTKKQYKGNDGMRDGFDVISVSVGDGVRNCIVLKLEPDGLIEFGTHDYDDDVIFTGDSSDIYSFYDLANLAEQV